MVAFGLITKSPSGLSALSAEYTSLSAAGPNSSSTKENKDDKKSAQQQGAQQQSSNKKEQTKQKTKQKTKNEEEQEKILDNILVSSENLKDVLFTKESARMAMQAFNSGTNISETFGLISSFSSEDKEKITTMHRKMFDDLISKFTEKHDEYLDPTNTFFARNLTEKDKIDKKMIKNEERQ